MSSEVIENQIMYLNGSDTDSSATDAILLDAVSPPVPVAITSGQLDNVNLLGGLPTGEFNPVVSTQIIDSNNNTVIADEQTQEQVDTNQAPSLDMLQQRSSGYLHNLQTTQTFPEDWWIDRSNEITATMREKMQFISDLKNGGLAQTLNNPLGNSISKTYKSTRAFSAITSMRLNVDVPRDKPLFDSQLDPNPVVMSGFTLEPRMLAAAAKGNFDLVNMYHELCREAVTDQLDINAINNTMNMGHDVRPLQSLLTFDGKLIGTLNQAWDDAVTVTQMYDDIIAMLGKLNTQKFYVDKMPISIYLNPSKRVIVTKMLRDVPTSTLRTSATLLTVIKEMDANITIKFHPSIPENTVAMIAMSKKGTVLREGIVPITVEWQDTHVLSVRNVLVVGMMPVHYSSDLDNNTNIIIYTS